ncbi:SDR family NAD(P)-dependent oxidoreductase [Rhodococcus sp. T2V]|uniref:SDR family NAD(P)-dependent oxidoreductase n=1 Tax=Rhodococcus sp. T2V TaxID=3034164 RepID=UPI0023E09B9D|nr:SDR family NAD(P)-dependent oxidoreductase [Rhodococcus sp. T2V]MDF3310785.1 SDR family NAD(P)-dependent oxidoreductase [Rhodococcus sp. T2V]
MESVDQEGLRRRYRDKVAIVTGAGSGIGRAIVEGLVVEGAYVVANDISRDRIESLESERVTVIAADVSEASAAGRLTAEALTMRGGRIDALFNNAGIGSAGPAVDIGAEEWRRVMAINIDAAFQLAASVGRVMIRRGGGAILNTASVAGTMGLPGRVPYVVSKHAVVGLTRALAVEWGVHGVRVNALCPGLTETAMSERLRREAPDYWAKREAVVPLRRAGTSAEQAAAALFLNSEEASYISGLIAEADGGAHALYSGYTVSRPQEGSGGVAASGVEREITPSAGL